MSVASDRLDAESQVRPMKLVVLAGDYPPAYGGIQKLSYGVAQALAEGGHEVRVIATAQRGADEFDARSKAATVRCRGGGRPAAAWSMAQAMQRVAREGFEADAVLATKWCPEGLAHIMSGYASRCPLVLMGHGREFLPERHRRLRSVAQRAVLRAASGAIANSGFTAGQFRAAGVPEERIRVVHPAVDPAELSYGEDLGALRRRLSWPEGRTLLTIARLVPRKGIDTVIQALPAIAKWVPDVRYVIIGEGSDRQRLTALAEACGVGPRVHFLGPVSEKAKPGALRLCDVFVMASQDIPRQPPEGFGIVYLEANLCGKPVIGADTGGVADAIEDGVTGVLVPPDRADRLAEAAIELLTSRQAARTMGEAGRKRVLERFTWATVGPQFARAIRELAVGEA